MFQLTLKKGRVIEIRTYDECCDEWFRRYRTLDGMKGRIKFVRRDGHVIDVRGRRDGEFFQEMDKPLKHSMDQTQ